MVSQIVTFMVKILLHLWLVIYYVYGWFYHIYGGYYIYGWLLLHLWVEAKDFDVILIVVSLHFIDSKA